MLVNWLMNASAITLGGNPAFNRMSALVIHTQVQENRKVERLWNIEAAFRWREL